MEILSSEVIGLYKGQEVILQKINDPHANYRVAYRGGGHYFEDRLTAVDYMTQRGMAPSDCWQKALKKEAADVWADYQPGKEV